jgi:hypothetical protein
MRTPDVAMRTSQSHVYYPWQVSYDGDFNRRRGLYTKAVLPKMPGASTFSKTGRYRVPSTLAQRQQFLQCTCPNYDSLSLSRIMILFFGPHTGSNYSNFVTLSQQTPCIRCHMSINSKHRRGDPRLQGPSSESSSILRPQGPHTASVYPARSWASSRCPCHLASELRSPWLLQATLGSNTPAASPQLAHPPSPPLPPPTSPPHPHPSPP